MWFQRIVEIHDDSEPEPVPTERLDTIRVNKMKMPKQPGVAVSTPAEFQRVRLMSIVRPERQEAKDESDTADAIDQSKTETMLKGEADGIPLDARWTKISRKLVKNCYLAGRWRTLRGDG
jgi:hypothetical protein